MSDARIGREIVVVTGDRTKCWRWAAIWIGVSTLVIPVAVAAAADEHGSLSALVLVACGLWCAVVILFSLHAYWWYRGPGSTVYVCDGVRLRAERRGRVLAEVRCEALRALAISHGLTWRSIAWTEAFPPSAPCLKTLVVDESGHSRGVNFPAILLWGDAEAADASRALATMAGLADDPAEASDEGGRQERAGQ